MNWQVAAAAVPAICPGPRTATWTWPSTRTRLLPRRSMSRRRLRPRQHNVLVAQISCPVPTGYSAPTFAGLQALAVFNGDPTNPSWQNPDFVTTDNNNPDIGSSLRESADRGWRRIRPNGVDAPAIRSPESITPKIGVPAINTPKIGTVDQQYARRSKHPRSITPKIRRSLRRNRFRPGREPDHRQHDFHAQNQYTQNLHAQDRGSQILTHQRSSNLAENPTRSRTTAGRSTTKEIPAPVTTQRNSQVGRGVVLPGELLVESQQLQRNREQPAGPNCSVCQLVQHKVYESPAANRDYNTNSSSTVGNPTCDLNVQQDYITVANIQTRHFRPERLNGSPANPTNSTLIAVSGRGKSRNPARGRSSSVSQTVSSFKTALLPLTAGQRSEHTPLHRSPSQPQHCRWQSLARVTPTRLPPSADSAQQPGRRPADPTNPIAVIPLPGRAESLCR